MRGGLEGTRVPNPAQDHSRFGVDDSFGRGEFEVALGVAYEQALLFGRAKRALREHASKGPRKGELVTISPKFSFPPRKPRYSAKRENCHRKHAAD